MLRAIAGLTLSVLLMAVAVAPSRAGESQDDLSAAAEAGSASAQLALGTALLESEAEEDWARGISWLEKAARQGMPVYLLIGDAYRDGIGVARDLEAAARWYRVGAEVGDGLAQLALGKMYLDGEGVIRDLLQAAVYLQLAEQRLSDSEARAQAQEALMRAKLWTSWEDWERARELVRSWKPKPVSELIN